MSEIKVKDEEFLFDFPNTHSIKKNQRDEAHSVSTNSRTHRKRSNSCQQKASKKVAMLTCCVCLQNINERLRLGDTIHASLMFNFTNEEEKSTIPDGITAMDMIEQVFNLQLMHRNQMLTSEICRTCLGDIKTSYLFKRRIQAWEERLTNEANNMVSPELLDCLVVLSKFDTEPDHSPEDNGEYNVGIKMEIQEGEGHTQRSQTFDSEHKTSEKPAKQPKPASESKERKKREIHTPSKQNGYFMCRCGKKFHRKENYRLHSYIHSEPIDCPECGLKVKNRPALKRHINVHHTRTSQRVCPLCGKIYSTQQELHKHQQTHSDLKPHACHLCDKSYKQKKKLVHHVMSQHCDARNFACEHCEKTFKTRLSLGRHVKAHVLINPYECTVCLEEYVNNHSLNMHFRAKHADLAADTISSRCVLCGEEFKETLHLHTHMIREHNLIEKLIKDDKLDKNKNESKEMEITGSKPLKNDRLITCALCDDAFRTTTECQQHMINVHNQRKETFKTNLTIKKVQFPSGYDPETNEDRLFFCRMCNKGFDDDKKCKKHERNHLKTKSGREMWKSLEKARKL